VLERMQALGESIRGEWQRRNRVDGDVLARP